MDFDILCEVYGKGQVVNRSDITEGVKVVEGGHSGVVSGLITCLGLQLYRWHNTYITVVFLLYVLMYMYVCLCSVFYTWMSILF